jgi:hypothetical protein
MGFSKLFTPTVTELEKMLAEIGEHEFGMYWHRRLMRADMVTGDPLAIDMIKQFAEKAYNVQEVNQKDKV